MQEEAEQEPLKIEEIAHEIGLTPEAVAQRKAFLEFSQTDAGLLRAVHDFAERRKIDADLADTFYSHLLAFPEMQHLIRDDAILQRLKVTQSRYFNQLTAGEYGPEYVLERLRVGLAHQRVGLDTQWYMGAYRKYLSYLLPVLRELCGADEKNYAATLDALLKVVFFDIGLALDAYFYCARRDLFRYSHHDFLTGLPNRELLHDRIMQALGQARRSDYGVGVIFIDLDRFRYVHDTLGHAASNEAIQMIAYRLVESVREGDTVARLGGDKFVVVLNGLEMDGNIGQFVEKLLARLGQPIIAGGRELFVSASMGIALSPADGDNHEELLKNAETAMYHTKQGGGNGFSYYRSAFGQYVPKRFNMETRLRRALENGEFHLAYQLQVDVASGRPSGAEALLRWNSPEGRVSPLDFIPLAEETGLILPIGEWVLEQACSQAVAWRAQRDFPFVVAVNLSARQLWGQDFVQTVSRILDKTGCKPGWLELEITENTLMVRPEEAVAAIRALARMGIRIAIDDFGTGYSSLAYLKLFPVQALKVDRAFVHQLSESSAEAPIVRAVIAMAHSMDIQVVAEGVEQEAQLVLLGEMGCDFAQGYYLAPPLPAEQVFDAMLSPGWLTPYRAQKMNRHSRRTRQLEREADIANCRVRRDSGNHAFCLDEHAQCRYLLPFSGECVHPLVDQIREDTGG